MSSVAVIGGGIIGRCCAYYLQQRGMQVTLLDNDSGLAAPSWNNAGHIAAEQVVPLASVEAILSAPRRLFRVGGALDFDFSTPGIARWVRLYLKAASPGNFARGRAALGTLAAGADKSWAALASELGAPGLYLDNGHWVVWESAGSAARGKARWQQSDIGTTSFRDLAPEALAILAERATAGITFRGTGQVAGHAALAERLKDRFVDTGGNWLPVSVAPLHLNKAGRAEVVLEGGEPTNFDKILVCAGAASARLLARIHAKIPLIAERGYHIEADCNDSLWPAVLPPVVFEDRALIVTRFGNRLRACSFVELSSLDAKPDARKWRQLSRHAAELGLPFSGQVSQWMGARPTLPDYLPAMGQSHRATNLYYAFGHQHLGLTLAPVTAQSMARLIAGDTTPSHLRPFSLSRFGC